MTTVQPRVTIPVTTGGPQRYGLFNVAIGPLDLPLHAGYGGVQYELEACGDNSVALHSAACASGDQLATGPGVQLILGDPFVVTAAIACQSVGRPLADFPRIAVERLTAGEQWAVEKAFWDGGPDLAGQIAGVGTLPDVTPTDSTKLSKVVGALEEWLYATAKYPYAGIIHAPVHIASEAAGVFDVQASTDQLKKTALGNVWCFGAGYSGRGPANTAGETWLAVTGAVRLFRSALPFVPEVPSALDRTTNVVEVVAEREYVLTVDCAIAVAKYTG
jgi:hypothetical protein